jgi:hypothetical protein
VTAWRTASSTPSSDASRDEACTASMAGVLTEDRVVDRFRFGGIGVGVERGAWSGVRGTSGLLRTGWVRGLL